MDELYRKLLAQLEEGQDTVLAFITEGDGSIPRTTGDRKSTRLNSSHSGQSRMPSSA